MTFLVTGATGFVGSSLIRALLHNGKDVRVLVRKDSDRTNLKGLNVEILVGDLTEISSLREACKATEGLFHVAADYRIWVKKPSVLYQNNVQGTLNLMRCALEAGISRIVYTSSVATLGNSNLGLAANETTPVRYKDMIGHYKRSKFLAERVVENMIRRQSLPAVIVNPSTPIGPRDLKPTPTGRILRDAAAGRIPAYVNTGLNLVHVDDVARGHILAFEKGKIGRKYILGGDDFSLLEILSIVANWANKKPPSIALPRKLIFPVAWFCQSWASLTNGPEPQITIDGLRMAEKNMFFDSGRAATELGYKWRGAESGIVDALEFFKQNKLL